MSVEGTISTPPGQMNIPKVNLFPVAQLIPILCDDYHTELVSGAKIGKRSPPRKSAMNLLFCHLLLCEWSGVGAFTRSLFPRRNLVIGFSLGGGLLLQIAPQLTDSISPSATLHLFTPMAFATILAVALNLVMRIGITHSEKVVFSPVGDSSRIQQKLNQLAELWGLQRPLMSRASWSLMELDENLRHKAEGPVSWTFEHDDLNLKVKCLYSGPPLEIPEQPPSTEQVLESPENTIRLSGWLLRKSSDSLKTYTTPTGQMIEIGFEC